MCELCATSPGAHLNIFGVFLIRAKTRPEARFCELKVSAHLISVQCRIENARRLLLESPGYWRYLGTLHNLEKRRGANRVPSSLTKSVATYQVLKGPRLQR